MKLFLLVVGFTILVEGLLPFFLPGVYRRMLAEIATSDPKIIRYAGFAAILAGIIILFLTKEFL